MKIVLEIGNEEMTAIYDKMGFEMKMSGTFKSTIKVRDLDKYIGLIGIPVSAKVTAVINAVKPIVESITITSEMDDDGTRVCVDFDAIEVLDFAKKAQKRAVAEERISDIKREANLS